jgi:Na+-transporting methylmalonyl-CoA/oxaloacetate decarboxylase gamma subunit
MKLTRIIFLALAVLIPTSWTMAKAEDAPATDAPKKEKKAKKAKKADKEDKKEDKKAE